MTPATIKCSHFLLHRHPPLHKVLIYKSKLIHLLLTAIFNVINTSLIISATLLITLSYADPPSFQVCSWVAHFIVSQNSQEERKAAYACLLRAALTCWNIGNFNGAMEITAGLRLVHTTTILFPNDFTFPTIIITDDNGTKTKP